VKYLFIGGKQDGIVFDLADDLDVVITPSQHNVNPDTVNFNRQPEAEEFRQEKYKKSILCSCGGMIPLIVYIREGLSLYDVTEMMINNYKGE